MVRERKTMRDAFFETLHQRMSSDDSIVFCTADFGSPKLDAIRADFPDRFVNVGIAEQNLVNVAAGMALEGCTAYAYAIAPFLTMRAFEQIRNNLSLLSHTHTVNVNLVGVGGGMSYDVSGPTHHSLEDIGIIRTLPNMTVFSPCDWVIAGRLVDETIRRKTPKYLRFDGKPLPNVYDPALPVAIEEGFAQLASGGSVCVVATGYTTHAAVGALDRLAQQGMAAGLFDVFRLKPRPGDDFTNAITEYRHIVTVEEGFAGKAGLDSLVACLLRERGSASMLHPLGFEDAYTFEMGGRDLQHGRAGIDARGIARLVADLSAGAS